MCIFTNQSLPFVVSLRSLKGFRNLRPPISWAGGCWVPGARCWVPGVGAADVLGRWVLGARSWVLGVECSVLGTKTKQKQNKQKNKNNHKTKTKQEQT